MSHRATIALAVTVMVVAMYGASAVMTRINQLRHELELIYVLDIADLPPQIALSQVALGSFRGLAVDILWNRAHDLEQSGRYHEAMQLARWISQLQPRYPRVWAFRAFTMSYNISVATHTGEERWMWVDQGVRLLRDEAIPLNPKSIILPFELARIYVDKIADLFDDFHYHYKQQLALEWHYLLGPPPALDREAFARWLEPLAAAPLSLDELFAAHPGTRAEFLRLQEGQLALDARLLREIVRLEQVRELEELGIPVEVRRRESLEALSTWLDSPTGEADRALLIAFCRARLVRAQQLDPARMIELTRRLGPLDWRDANSHGLYWTDDGRRKLAERPELVAQEDRQFWNIFRMDLKAGKQLYLAGTLVFDPNTGAYQQLPNPEFYELYENTVAEALAAVPPDMANVRESFVSSLKNFRMWAVWVDHYYGKGERSQRIFAELQQEYPGEFPGSWQEYLWRTTAEELMDATMTPEKARQQLAGLLRQAVRALRGGRLPVYERFLGQCQRIHDTILRLAGRPVDPRDFPPLDEQLAAVYLAELCRPRSESNPIALARTWRHTPVPVRRATYDGIQSNLGPRLRALGLNAREVFTEPPEMDAYRAAQAARKER